MSGDFPAPRMAASAPQYAGFWIRVVATIIDAILLKVIAVILGFAGFAGSMGAGMMPGQLGSSASLWTFLIAIVYYAAFESSVKQATPGKMALGLKVTDVQGKRLTVLRAACRYAAKILSALILGIGFIMVAFTQKKQGLHDLIVGTVVVKA